MATFWALFSLLHVLSFGFALLSLGRLFHYIRRYRFDESKYTLLFGFIHLRAIAVFYFVFGALWTALTYMMIMKF